MCTYAAKVWALSVIQGPFSAPNLGVTIRNFFIAVRWRAGAQEELQRLTSKSKDPGFDRLMGEKKNMEREMRLGRKEREVLAARCEQREKELDSVHAGHKRSLHKKQREIDAMGEELLRAKDIQRELRVKVRDLTRCGVRLPPPPPQVAENRVGSHGRWKRPCLPSKHMYLYLRDDIYPREPLVASPSELSASPSELSASPSELSASPSELSASPSELSVSPSELSASPSEL
jgi:hypothetical protein